MSNYSFHGIIFDLFLHYNTEKIDDDLEFIIFKKKINLKSSKYSQRKIYLYYKRFKQYTII